MTTCKALQEDLVAELRSQNNQILNQLKQNLESQFSSFADELETSYRAKVSQLEEERRHLDTNSRVARLAGRETVEPVETQTIPSLNPQSNLPQNSQPAPLPTQVRPQNVPTNLTQRSQPQTSAPASLQQQSTSNSHHQNPAQIAPARQALNYRSTLANNLDPNGFQPAKVDVQRKKKAAAAAKKKRPTSNIKRGTFVAENGPQPQRAAKRYRVFLNVRGFDMTKDDILQYAQNWDIPTQYWDDVEIVEVARFNFVVSFNSRSDSHKDFMPNGIPWGYHNKTNPTDYRDRPLTNQLYIQRVDEGRTLDEVAEEINNLYENIDTAKTKLQFVDSSYTLPETGRHHKYRNCWCHITSNTNGVRPRRKQDWTFPFGLSRWPDKSNPPSASSAVARRANYDN